MTFSIFFAFALGAISAVSEAPIARPAMVNVVRASATEREQRLLLREIRTFPLARTSRRACGFAATASFAALPLTGAATARAPGRFL